MVDLLALVFVTVLGASLPDTEPTAVFYYKDGFEDVALCEAAKESDDVKDAVEWLKNDMQARFPKDKVEIKLQCRE
jgi:hypothetical protein